MLKRILALVAVLLACVLFAGCMSQSDVNAAYKSGYAEGHDAGYSEGEEAANEAHAGDYESGKIAGYNEGYEDAKEEYSNSGYSAGYDDGYDDGYEHGVDSVSLPSSYSTSSLSTTSTSTSYVINRSSKIFHYAWCSSVSQMKESNKMYSTASRTDLVSQGYSACKRCCP